ncbi:unnamed protein product [Didymodactylos carnosus]|uniref:Tumor protein p53-inducible protein 11 n=1 Tax=Didymodactylos carnosus TaxID=1234261 RepID=A0A816ENQ0_9BILA|nr:unnamed protein product [Didymodactylos carnosus]CAF1649915.1 unnamed protein product [Didymodactylos carnosus]CAF4109775.1 unnamed protein product [Didymodactylos carnosus]CAF4576089.1 unnamed protein product [Didymodactylos carnosus]
MEYYCRKNSCGDLQSRLKVRKVLGVGKCGDDGDIYSSKISQILGHSDHLVYYTPNGLILWLMIMAIVFGSLCVSAAFFPQLLFLLLPGSEKPTINIHLALSYGGMKLKRLFLKNQWRTSE